MGEDGSGLDMLMCFDLGFSVLGGVCNLTLRVGESLLVNSKSDKVLWPTSFTSFLLFDIPMLFPYAQFHDVIPLHVICCSHLSVH